MRPRVLAVANAKGGVGKTSLAVHLAAGAARKGQRVLLVDLDPQGNASAWLLGDVPAGATGSADALLGRPARALEVPGREGLEVLPATPALAGAEAALAAEVGGHALLAAALEALDGHDLIILDTPPSLGLVVLSALVAAEGVVVPVSPAYLSISGLLQLEATIERVRVRLHGRARVLGYVLLGADGREGITAEVRELLAGQAGGLLYRVEVRVSAAAKALPASRLTAYDPGADARGAADYPAVLAETMRRLGAKPRGRRGARAPRGD